MQDEALCQEQEGKQACGRCGYTIASIFKVLGGTLKNLNLFLQERGHVRGRG